MGALFEKLPILLVAAAAGLAALQVAQMFAIAGQPGATLGTVLAMIFGVVVQAAQLLALAALVHYARRIAANTGEEA